MKGERMNGRETEKEGLRKEGMGWYANVSLRESRRKRLLRGNFSELAMFTATRSESSRFFSQR